MGREKAGKGYLSTPCPMEGGRVCTAVPVRDRAEKEEDRKTTTLIKRPKIEMRKKKGGLVPNVSVQGPETVQWHVLYLTLILRSGRKLQRGKRMGARPGAIHA